MIDHIGLFVSDAAQYADFYEKLLAPLGYVKKVAYPTAVCFANDEDGDSVWLESPKDGNPVVPSHVAFRARMRPPSRHSMRPVSPLAVPTTALRARARTMAPRITPRSSTTRTAIILRPC